MVSTVRWGEFEEAAPQIATLARERFERDQLVLVGTLRTDGSPRISPNEVDFAAGRLFLGMMWNSRKSRDLERDPRLTIHSVPPGRDNPLGDVKLYGRAVAEEDPEVRTAFEDAVEARIQWRPDRYHLWSLDVEAASYVLLAPEQRILSWTPGTGVRRLSRPD